MPYGKETIETSKSELMVLLVSILHGGCNVLTIIRNSDQYEIELSANVLSSIWKARNAQHTNNKTFIPKEVLY